MVRRCVWSRNIKNRRSIYICDISSLRVKITCLGVRKILVFKIRFSVRRPVILINLFHLLPQSLQAYYDHVSNHDPAVFHSTLHKTESLNKRNNKKNIILNWNENGGKIAVIKCPFEDNSIHGHDAVLIGDFLRYVRARCFHLGGSHK